MKTSHFRHDRACRGSATVELAILSLILVPVVLYSFFGGEAGKVLLLMQEEVIATIWDFSTYPYSLSDTYQASLVSQEFKKNVDDQNPVSAFGRIQYIDEDSSFTNSSRTSTGQLTDPKTHEKYVTNGFVVGTHCGATRCANYLTDYNRPSDSEIASAYKRYQDRQGADENYWTNHASELRDMKDDHVHEVFCGIESKDAGNFMTAKAGAATSSGAISKVSQGGLMACQAKARLKNYLIPSGKFFPDFYGENSELGGKGYTGETMKRYSADDNVIDYQAFSGDIVVRHRASLLVNAWNLTDHSDQEMYSKANFIKETTQFKKATETVLKSADVYSVPFAYVTTYSNAVRDIADVPILIDTDIRPSILRTNMATAYPHGSGKLSDYNYDPPIAYSGISGVSNAFKRFLLGQNTTFFTTPMFDGTSARYASAFNSRGKYYMGTKTSGASASR